MQVPEDVVKRLKTLAKEPFNVLIVEDSQQNRDMLKMIFKMKCPNAVISSFLGHEFENIEEVIKNGNFDFVVLDFDISGFGAHPVYGTEGPNLIPLFKNQNPNVIILSISASDESNRIAEKRGADCSVLKAMTPEFIDLCFPKDPS